MSGGLPQRATGQRRRRRIEEDTAVAQPSSHSTPSAAAEATDHLQGQSASFAPDLSLVEHRHAAENGANYEYLDHPADVQLHAWGSTLEVAFEGAALAMYNYMTPLSGLTPDTGLARTFHAEAHDLHSLLFGFLDELLFVFSTELLVCCSLTVTHLDREKWTITAEGQGEKFDRQRHAIGTEIKAITYSAMQIREVPGDAEVFVIVDI
ncbi:hypothetical protein WJX73_003257 [Symbiochloris irregularis]|uniref:Archease domain-containing protein n=1 Tax=Symbiochloris irregularis TaxID=706552 RepID=A0AAW1P2X7_9CHLO